MVGEEAEEVEEIEFEEIDEDALLEQMDAMQDPLVVCREILEPERAVPNEVLSKEQALELHRAGFVVLDGFVDAELAGKVAEQAKQLYAQGLMRTPHAHDNDANLDVHARGDVTMWVHHGEYADTPLGAAIERLMLLRRALASFVLLHPEELVELQLALYNDTGAHYVRHRDALPCGASPDEAHLKPRRVTAVMYTSLDWTDEQGGELRLFRNRADREGMAQVAPRAGRVALFLSGAIDHEVLPSYAPRAALTAWFH